MVGTIIVARDVRLGNRDVDILQMVLQRPVGADGLGPQHNRRPVLMKQTASGRSLIRAKPKDAMSRKTSRYGLRRIVLLAAIVAVVCAIGCSRPREGLITHVEDPQFSEGELYWRVIDLSPLFADGVEAAPILSSRGQPIRRSSGGPSCGRSTLSPSPRARYSVSIR